MRPLLIFACLITLSACAPITIPLPLFSNSKHFEAGERVSPPGVSFTLPKGSDWMLAPNTKTKFSADISLYPQAFYQHRKSRRKRQSLEIDIIKFSVQSYSLSKEGFFDLVKAQRTPKSGNIRVIKDSQEFYSSRSETCVIYKSAGEFVKPFRHTHIEEYGMSCIHPYNPSVGITIEWRRFYYPDSSFPGFNDIGEALFKSVTFREF